jgi:quercetin dioxygenase-like cupin family protein
MIEIAGGERITGEGELGVTLLADVEQIAVADVRWEPGGGIAPPLHVHERHAECFFVMEGELTFRLEDRELSIGAETWVLVPPIVAHSFTVTGDAPARFLDIHTPSCGFGDFVRRLYAAESEGERQTARDAFDQLPPKEYATADPGLVVVNRTGDTDGETVRNSPETGRATILVDSDELNVTEFVFPAGRRGAQRHVHHLHADAFLVVEGELALHDREGTTVAPAPTLLLFPPNVVHGFDNDSAETARCFNFHTPATGFTEYMRGRKPDFDQHEPPADGGVDPSAIVAVRLEG